MHCLWNTTNAKPTHTIHTYSFCEKSLHCPGIGKSLLVLHGFLTIVSCGVYAIKFHVCNATNSEYYEIRLLRMPFSDIVDMFVVATTPILPP